MGDDNSKESAVKFLLGEVIDFLLGTPDFGFYKALQSGALRLRVDAEGWAELACEGKSGEGYGGLSFVYRPRDFATKLYKEAAKKFDEVAVRCHYSNEDAVKWALLRDNVTAEYREQAICEAVRLGLTVVLGQIMLTMGKTFRDQYRDSLTAVVAVLELSSVNSFEGQTYEEDGDKVKVLEVERRVNALVENRVKDVSSEKREYFAALFSNIAALRVSTGKVGRPPGVKNIKTAEELDRENAAHRRIILNAMCAIYSKAENKFLAEDAITKKAVADEMGYARGTLDAWLNSGKFDFESLKEEALNMCRRN